MSTFSYLLKLERGAVRRERERGTRLVEGRLVGSKGAPFFKDDVVDGSDDLTASERLGPKPQGHHGPYAL